MLLAWAGIRLHAAGDLLNVPPHGVARLRCGDQGACAKIDVVLGELASGICLELHGLRRAYHHTKLGAGLSIGPKIHTANADDFLRSSHVYGHWSAWELEVLVPRQHRHHLHRCAIRGGVPKPLQRARCRCTVRIMCVCQRPCMRCASTESNGHSGNSFLGDHGSRCVK